MVRVYLSFFFFLAVAAGFSQQQIIADIQIKGAKKLKKSFVARLINVEKETILDSLVLNEDINRLKRLPSVAHAYYNVKALEGDKVNVIYVIEENFTIIPFASLYTSSNDAFAFRVGLQEFNFLGRNMTLGGFYQYDVFNSYGINFRAPNLFSRKLGLAVEYKDLTTQEPVFFANSAADYRYNNKGIEVLGLYEFNFKNRIELGFSFFEEDYKYLSGITSPDVPQQLNVQKHLLKLIYNYDNVRYFYQYLEGFRSTLNFQYVGSANKNLSNFLIGFNDFLYFHRIGKKGNWANRVRLGLASNQVTPFAPFTVDNNLNIRGVGNTIDRGSGAIVFNTEYRHTIVDKDWFVLQGNVFVDGGTWRNPGGDFSDFTNSDNIRIFPGIGLRFIHKRIFNAIFRIDYGHGVTNDKSRGLVFGIGQYF